MGEGQFTRPWQRLSLAGITALFTFVAGALVAASCADEDLRFRCGVKRADGVVVSCTEPREVCICATNTCAVRTDADECTPTNLRYVQADIMNNVCIDKCVPPEHAKWLVDEDNVGAACTTSPPADAGAAGAGGEAPSSSTGAGGFAPLDCHRNATQASEEND